MTATLTHPPRPAHPSDYPRLAALFHPLFEAIREGARDRDASRTLPFEQVAQLKAARFGALRVPTSHGGFGATIPDTTALLIELSAADPNLTQALRGHFAFAEHFVAAPPGPDRDTWLARFAAGQLAGNAWTEVGDVPVGQVRTTVAPTADPQVFVVNGSKYYSTGSIFADWVDLYAQRADTGEHVIAAVDAHAKGVTHLDDWDGFGQQTTGTGTSTYQDVPVPAQNLIPFATRFRYQTAFYQLFHLATLAGIAHDAAREVTDRVRARTRVFSHGNAPSYAADPQIQQVVGEVTAAAYAAHALALRAAQDVQEAHDSAHGDPQRDREANIAAELSTAQAQVVASTLVPAATTRLFDALSASALSAQWGLDRHWRNARAVASHNPWVFKAKVVGDHAINGTDPVYVWAIGAGRPTTHP